MKGLIKLGQKNPGKRLITKYFAFFPFMCMSVLTACVCMCTICKSCALGGQNGASDPL